MPHSADIEPLPQHALAWKTELAQKVLPYWFDTAQDREHGGYLLADDLKGRKQASEKQLVSQTRTRSTWTVAGTV